MFWLASSSFGCRFTWPVTVAPAWRSADVMPVTTGPGAPGALTTTTRCPLSRPSSIRASPACATAWSALTCWFSSAFLACVASYWFFICCDVFLSTSIVVPCSSVEPSTIPIARARNTATIETTW